MRHVLVALSLILALSACGDPARDLQEPTEPLGDFQIGHIGVVAPNLQKLLVSREATKDEWTLAVSEALSRRFERFDGGKFYHLGVSVEAYSLPPPIIPGKSALALNVTVWDDAAHAKLNEEPKQVHIIRIIESRLASTKDSQIAWLVAEAAKEIERWMREMQESDGWFTNTEATAPSEVVGEDTSEAAEQDASEEFAGAQIAVPEQVVSTLQAAQVEVGSTP